MPAHYSVSKWPKGLRIDQLHVYLGDDLAVAVINGATLKPYIPLDQLARCLDDHVQGAVDVLTFRGGDGLEDGVPRLLDEMTVPGRLHMDFLNFTDFFPLPLVSIERILDGRTLRAKQDRLPPSAVAERCRRERASQVADRPRVQ